MASGASWTRDHRLAFWGILVPAAVGIVGIVVASVVGAGSSGPTSKVETNSGTIQNGTVYNYNVPPSGAPGGSPAGSASGLPDPSATDTPSEPTEYGPYPERTGYLCGSTLCAVAPVVTLNSAVDNPSVGDERPFFSVTINGAPVVNRLDVHAGDTVTLRIYVDNNAAGNVAAEHLRLRVLVPTAERDWFNLVAFISATNAQPATINDTVLLVGDRELRALYMPGSVQAHRLDSQGRSVVLPVDDSIVSTLGADLGSLLPGANNGVFVTMQVRVVAA